jgi:hypothetical protein
LSVQSNISQVRRELSVTRRQARSAAMHALNETAFDVRRGLQAEMRKVFDRPTRFIVNALRVVLATESKLRVEIYPDDPGGKAVDPQSVLHAEVFGGLRNGKRAEKALQRTGLLAPGWAMVPAAGAPRDAYGNVPGPFIVQILSYLNAFAEQGYRANMSERRRRQLAKPGLSKGGFKTVRGVEYFVSRGRGTWASKATSRAGALFRTEGQHQHLPAGIWRRSGTHGSEVKPVFLFVRMPSYQARLDFDGVAERIARQQFPTRYAARLLSSAVRNGLKTR